MKILIALIIFISFAATSYLVGQRILGDELDTTADRIMDSLVGGLIVFAVSLVFGLIYLVVDNLIIG